MRPPISLERMSWDGVGEVRYRRKRGHESSGVPVDSVETLEPAELHAQVIMHIPEPRRHLERYCGAHSNVSRGRHKRFMIAGGDETAEVDSSLRADRERERSPDGRALRRRWRQLIKRVYEVDLLVCPRSPFLGPNWVFDDVQERVSG